MTIDSRMNDLNDDVGITLLERARVLHFARGRCGNCSRSIARDSVVLLVRRKLPVSFDGTLGPENLWAICEECVAQGEWFRRVTPNRIRKIRRNRSVHVRLGETLKVFRGEPVPGSILKFIAEEDAWTKRVRELRYLGWEIAACWPKVGATRVSPFYRLVRSQPWPDDPTGYIRRYERDRAERNRARKRRPR